MCSNGVPITDTQWAVTIKPTAVEWSLHPQNDLCITDDMRPDALNLPSHDADWAKRRIRDSKVHQWPGDAAVHVGDVNDREPDEPTLGDCSPGT